MIPPFVFRRRIFGIEFNIEFDFFTAIFQTWQFVYEISLKNSIISRQTIFDFMNHALKGLPYGSFIIFNFDKKDKAFIQFAKEGEDIMLLAPIFSNNCYAGKKQKLKKLLVDFKIKKSAIRWVRNDKEDIDLYVNFKRNAARASRFAIHITQDVFGLDKPKFVGYETHRLVRATSQNDVSG